MSKRRSEPYEGLGKNKLEYVKVVPKFLQAHSRPPPTREMPEENEELEEKEEKELIEKVIQEQKEEEEKRKEFYNELGVNDPKPRARIPSPEPVINNENENEEPEEYVLFYFIPFLFILIRLF